MKECPACHEYKKLDEYYISDCYKNRTRTSVYCKKCLREKQKEYREKNLEYCKTLERKWAARRRKSGKAQKCYKDFIEKNPDYRREYMREWKRKNRDRWNEYQREYNNRGKSI